MTARTLYGREPELVRLKRWLVAGEIVLVHGRVGAGKSTLLRVLEDWARQGGRPCALAPRTDSLSDFTEALARAYRLVPVAGTQRQRRARLRAAAELEPGILLFDDLGHTGRAFKGALRSVRGIGLGVAFAADVETARDRERVRSLGLSFHEMELEPMHGGSIRALIRSRLEQQRLPFDLAPDDWSALVAAADGLPGRAVDFVDALVDPGSWSDGRPRVAWLRTSSVIRAAERYRQRLLPR